MGFAYVTYEERNYAELAESPAHLHDIYVEESARRSGAGDALIDAAEQIVLISMHRISIPNRLFMRTSFYCGTLIGAIS